MHKLYLSLGSNLGDRTNNIQCAIDLLNERVGVVSRVSSFVETMPWGFHSNNQFLNACVLVHTKLSPLDCLEQTQQIEKMLGRTKKSTDGIYHDRLIDIDLLVYDDIVIDTPELQLPHPHMWERDFVMRPLKEIM